jgi:hypothetical protein
MDYFSILAAAAEASSATTLAIATGEVGSWLSMWTYLYST